MDIIESLYYKIFRWASPRGEHTFSAGLLQDRLREKARVYSLELEGKILEVGCGEGFFLRALARSVNRLSLFGVDVDEGHLKLGKILLKGNNRVNISLSRQDARVLAFKDHSFDVVVCINVFYNLDSWETVCRVMEEMARVCKPKGQMIFDFRVSGNPVFNLKDRWARYYDKTLTHSLSSYHPAKIRGLLSRLDLKVVKSEHLGGLLGMITPIRIYKVYRP